MTRASNTTRMDESPRGETGERRIIVNPESGTGDHVPEVRQLAENRGYSVRETTGTGHASELAEAAVADGIEVLAACGGDGTLREVIQGLVKADALDDVLVGVVPAGTANVVATDFGIEDIEAGFEVLDTGKVRNIDLGIADGEPFIKSCIAGLTADASAATTSDVKARFGPLAFVITGIQQAATFEALRVTVTATDEDGTERAWSGEALCVLVGNSRRFTNQLGQANVEDGLFDVTLVEEMPPGERMTEAIAQQLLGWDTEHVTRLKAKRLEIEGDEPIDFSLDGEIHTHDRLDLRVRPGVLSMPVGPEYEPDPAE